MDEIEKTSLYSNEKDQKTGIYNESYDKTGIYSDKKQELKSSVHGLNTGDHVFLKEKEYTVKKIISKGTGEAIVYQIEDNAGNLYALKLYFEFKDEAEEPNSLALERIQKLDDPDILKLIDFGIGPDKYKGKFCFEISEFAQGGNILDLDDFKSKYTPEFVLESIVPQIYLAVTKLHEYKIYHCDIKPANIFYKDKEQTDIIIGDYGSAKAYDLKSEKTIRKSTTIKGTEYYLAPEQARGIVSEKNDYYSFGMVLLHLLYPDSFAKAPDYRSIDKEKFEQIVERQYNLKPIVEFDSKLKVLNNLIEGLTLINHINRWGSEEFEKWLNGEKVEVSYRTKTESDVKPLKTGPIEIYNSEEFVNYIETNHTWFEDFFEDNDVYKLIKEWLDSYIGIPNRKRFEKLVSIYKLSGKLMLQSAISRFLLPDMPVYVEGEAFNFANPESHAKEVERYLAKVDSIYKSSTIDELVLYFFQLEYTLKDLYYLNPGNSSIKALLFKLYNPLNEKINLPDNFDFTTIIPSLIKPSKGAFNFEPAIGIFHVFNDHRPYPDNNYQQIFNTEQLAVYYLKHKDYYNDKYHVFERNAFLKKIKMQKLVGADFDDLVSQTLSKEAEIKVKIHHIGFDKICNVHYSLNHVLDSFLRENEINETITAQEDKGYIYVAKNNFFTGFAANKFIKYLIREHGSMSGWPSSLTEIKSEFKKKHRKYYLANSIVSILTAIFVIAVVVAIILKVLKIFNLVGES